MTNPNDDIAKDRKRAFDVLRSNANAALASKFALIIGKTVKDVRLADDHEAAVLAESTGLPIQRWSRPLVITFEGTDRQIVAMADAEGNGFGHLELF